VSAGTHLLVLQITTVGMMSAALGASYGRWAVAMVAALSLLSYLAALGLRRVLK
jgi:hypothetical protein